MKIASVIVCSEPPRDRFSGAKLKMSIDYIFGRGNSKSLDLKMLGFEYSRRTGRLRYVLDKSTKNVLFTFRQNGSIAPTIEGTNLLLLRANLSKIKARPSWTITVVDGVSDLIVKGKTAFCKHVVHCSDSVRAGEDVAILNESGKILAVGRTVVSGPQMKQFKRGPAVKVREGASDGSDEF